MSALKKENISDAVIRRLPRYYRQLTDLCNRGVVRISSHSLGQEMNITASQITGMKFVATTGTNVIDNTTAETLTIKVAGSPTQTIVIKYNDITFIYRYF